MVEGDELKRRAALDEKPIAKLATLFVPFLSHLNTIESGGLTYVLPANRALATWGIDSSER